MIPVVFVHGFMGGSAQWRGQTGALDGYDVIALDLPGFGDNAAKDTINSIAGFASWALAELSARGVEQFHLVGHSMGGMIAQDMVTQAPDRIEKLVLYGTGATGELPGRFETIEISKERARADGAKSTARRIAATWFLQKEAAPEYESCAQIAERSSMAAILAGLDAMQVWNGVGNLSEITSNTLVVWSDQERTYSWGQTEQLWKSIPKTRLAIMPDCSHAAHLEKPQMFNGVVMDFLQEEG